MLSIAVGAYLCGHFMDWGASPRVLTVGVGVSMVFPIVLWGWAMRPWRAPAELQPVQKRLC